jgi:hypothetical protein
MMNGIIAMSMIQKRKHPSVHQAESAHETSTCFTPLGTSEQGSA